MEGNKVLPLTLEPGNESRISSGRAKYIIGSRLSCILGDVEVVGVEEEEGQIFYQVSHVHFGGQSIGGRFTQRMLENTGLSLRTRVFNVSPPVILSVDNFYRDPDRIRELALAQPYFPNIKAYKGKRTSTKFLFPGVKEQFEKLLGVSIANWLVHGVNGVFQITNHKDPLVYHSDLQSYAAAVYLTPNAPPGMGTSFWRSRKYQCRRPPLHPAERGRFPDDASAKAASDDMYSEYNLLHPDEWELLDKVAGLYNRLVIWDSQMVHSASSYEYFPGEEGENSEAEGSRLVQLFFFDIAQ